MKVELTVRGPASITEEELRRVRRECEYPDTLLAAFLLDDGESIPPFIRMQGKEDAAQQLWPLVKSWRAAR